MFYNRELKSFWFPHTTCMVELAMLKGVNLTSAMAFVLQAHLTTRRPPLLNLSLRPRSALDPALHRRGAILLVRLGDLALQTTRETIVVSIIHRFFSSSLMNLTVGEISGNDGWADI